MQSRLQTLEDEFNQIADELDPEDSSPIHSDLLYGRRYLEQSIAGDNYEEAHRLYNQADAYAERIPRQLEKVKKNLEHAKEARRQRQIEDERQRQLWRALEEDRKGLQDRLDRFVQQLTSDEYGQLLGQIEPIRDLLEQAGASGSRYENARRNLDNAQNRVEHLEEVLQDIRTRRQREAEVERQRFKTEAELGRSEAEQDGQTSQADLGNRSLTQGEVFQDIPGELSTLREMMAQGGKALMPEDHPSMTISDREMEPEPAASQPKHLSPANPLNWLRVIWWVCIAPEKIADYREQHGEEVLRRIGAWSTSTLVWLLFFIPVLGLWVGSLPATGHMPTGLSWVLGVVVIFSWGLIGLMGDQANKDFNVSMVFSVILGITGVAAVGVGVFVAASTPGIVEWVIIFVVTGFVPGSVAFFLAFFIAATVGVSLSENIRNKRGSIGIFLALILSYATLIWISFLGGYKFLEDL